MKDGLPTAARPGEIVAPAPPTVAPAPPLPNTMRVRLQAFTPMRVSSAPLA